ncbi:MAG TPA: pilus assembly protein PilP [Gammaproteobacteria bacterium]|nr:pilus assembly protein PilP [Gammaproteobacteria bacterium]
MTSTSMRRAAMCLAMVCVLPLAGCGNHTALQAWVAHVKARPGGKISPVPKPKPYKGYAYSAGDLRSPFIPASKPDNNIRPNLHRKKQFLEQFPLDSLKLVGEIQINGTQYALIEDPQGLVHKVTKGNYMGQNNGRITAILPNGIRLTEIVPNGSGGWLKRPASLSLAQKSGG